jgi:tRNA (guanine37-N1)-methyltransferase
MMRARQFHLITIFPDIFDSYINESLFRRAIKNKIISVRTYDLRNFSDVRYGAKAKKGFRPFAQVDDRPFGGGPGMVLKIEPIYRAVETIKLKVESEKSKAKNKNPKVRIILFSTRGKKFDAKAARRLAKYDDLIFICGRYEGVDERVAKYVADEEISMGDYVLSGGEIPALAVMESVSRYIPGFLGKKESLEETNGSFPTYTRPPRFFPEKFGKASLDKKSKLKKRPIWPVPKILFSGDHEKIQEWRKRK